MTRLPKGIKILKFDCMDMPGFSVRQMFNPRRGVRSQNYIKGLNNLINLEELFIKYISDKELYCLRNLKNLKYLVIEGDESNPKITDNGLYFIPKSIEKLELNAHNNFTDLGLQYLAKLPKLRELRIRESLLNGKKLNFSILPQNLDVWYGTFKFDLKKVRSRCLYY